MSLLHILVLACLTVSSLAACDDFSVQTPAGFIELDSAEYDYQATNAEGVVLAIRSFDAHAADAQFWESVVTGQMKRLGAYRTISELALTTADGTTGKQLCFEREQAGATHSYCVSVLLKHDSIAFFDRSRLFIIESGGEQAAYAAQQAALQLASSELELDLPL